jgi:ABC-2 type transport system ATP-binding protein
VQLQGSSVQPRLRVHEAVRLFADLTRSAPDVEQLLESVQLLPRAKARVDQLSGGQRQRLLLALALVHDPELLFLDEVSSGLDPEARRNVWNTITVLRDRGATIVMTTHFMDEAQHLCDRVAFLNGGRIVGIGTPGDLIAELHMTRRVRLRLAHPERGELVGAVAGCRYQIEGRELLGLCDNDEAIGRLVEAAVGAKVGLVGVEVDVPTLDDVFVALAKEGGR